MLQTPARPDLLAILRGVSRSFYLSIRLLPAQLRQPVGLAYLLARASDTIADTAEIPANERASNLALLGRLFDGTDRPTAVGDLAAWFAPFQHDEREHALIVALPECFAWLAQLGPEDCEDVRTVLGHITRGQELDVERFATPDSLTALASAAELDQYTWLVAGCVGEFWTRLCARHLPAFAGRDEAAMRLLGSSFGMSLQLVNILRDVGEDLRDGRCYLPADELAAIGVDFDVLRARPQSIEPVWQRWLAKAEAGLDRGLDYALAVKSRRVRAASALPALLGVRTLALLKAAGVEGALARKVKMERSEVRGILAKIVVTAASADSLRAQYQRLKSGR